MSLRLTLFENLKVEAWPSSWHWHAGGDPGASWMWSLLFMGRCAPQVPTGVVLCSVSLQEPREP